MSCVKYSRVSGRCFLVIDRINTETYMLRVVCIPQFPMVQYGHVTR